MGFMCNGRWYEDSQQLRDCCEQHYDRRKELQEETLTEKQGDICQTKSCGTDCEERPTT